MSTYKVLMMDRAIKKLNRITPKHREQILDDVDALGKDPFPQNCKALQGQLKSYMRIRVLKDYRVVYQVDQKAMTVTVFTLGHRKEVYGWRP